MDHHLHSLFLHSVPHSTPNTTFFPLLWFQSLVYETSTSDVDVSLLLPTTQPSFVIRLSQFNILSCSSSINFCFIENPYSVFTAISPSPIIRVSLLIHLIIQHMMSAYVTPSNSTFTPSVFQYLHPYFSKFSSSSMTLPLCRLD